MALGRAHTSAEAQQCPCETTFKSVLLLHSKFFNQKKKKKGQKENMRRNNIKKSKNCVAPLSACLTKCAGNHTHIDASYQKAIKAKQKLGSHNNNNTLPYITKII